MANGMGNTILPFDEINRLEMTLPAYFDNGKIKSDLLDDLLDALEDLFLLSYALGENAKNFATRLYTCCLGRDPEADGLNYWGLALTNLEKTGCEAAGFFFTGAEFEGLGTSNEEYVKRLYKTFMDRTPAADEVKYWVGQIKSTKMNRKAVLEFFGQCEEFTNICAKYGIDRGTI